MYKYYLVGSTDNIFLFLKKCIELYIIRKEGRKGCGQKKMGMTNKIKALCAMRGITQQELADKLNTPQSNLSKKYKKDDWRESDLQKIAEVLNADFKGCFILNETDEQF